MLLNQGKLALLAVPLAVGLCATFTASPRTVSTVQTGAAHIEAAPTCGEGKTYMPVFSTLLNTTRSRLSTVRTRIVADTGKASAADAYTAALNTFSQKTYTAPNYHTLCTLSTVLTAVKKEADSQIGALNSVSGGEKFVSGGFGAIAGGAAGKKNTNAALFAAHIIDSPSVAAALAGTQKRATQGVDTTFDAQFPTSVAARKNYVDWLAAQQKTFTDFDTAFASVSGTYVKNAAAVREKFVDLSAVFTIRINLATAGNTPSTAPTLPLSALQAQGATWSHFFSTMSTGVRLYGNFSGCTPVDDGTKFFSTTGNFASAVAYVLASQEGKKISKKEFGKLYSLAQQSDTTWWLAANAKGGKYALANPAFLQPYQKAGAGTMFGELGTAMSPTSFPCFSPSKLGVHMSAVNRAYSTKTAAAFWEKVNYEFSSNSAPLSSIYFNIPASRNDARFVKALTARAAYTRTGLARWNVAASAAAKSTTLTEMIKIWKNYQTRETKLNNDFRNTMHTHLSSLQNTYIS